MNDVGKDDEARPTILAVGVGKLGADFVLRLGRNLKQVTCIRVDADGMIAPSDAKTLPEVSSGASGDANIAASLRSLAAGTDCAFVITCIGNAAWESRALHVSRLIKDLGVLTIGMILHVEILEDAISAENAESIELFGKACDTFIEFPLEKGRAANTVASVETLSEAITNLGLATIQSFVELLTVPGIINVDLADLRTMFTEQGRAFVSQVRARGNKRATIASRILEDSRLGLPDLRPMTDVTACLANVRGGPDITLDEVQQVLDGIVASISPDANIIFGSTIDAQGSDEIEVHVLSATAGCDVRSSLPIKRPRVFISYSHEDVEHNARVLALAQQLRRDGVDCRLDRFTSSPIEGWPRWMIRQIEQADKVLLVVTGEYNKRFAGESAEGVGLGATFESFIMTQVIYDSGSRSEKFVPVVFELSCRAFIPRILRGFTHFTLPAQYDLLRRNVTSQVEVAPEPLGKLVSGAGRPAALVDLPIRSDGASTAISTSPNIVDERSRLTVARLETVLRMKEEMLIGGLPTGDVDKELGDLKRQLRDAGQPRVGDFLADDRYRLVAKVGEGGFATVWKAFDRRFHRVVAVKVLHSHLGEDKTKVDRFFRGARTMLQINHPGIVRVLDERCEDGPLRFFVMEFCAGGDLDAAVLSGAVPHDEVVGLICAVGEALKSAHALGSIHRDVKPQNILLRADRVPCLTDFDLVKVAGSDAGTRTGTLGTIIYASPEAMYDAATVGPEADVYSLAMTTVFALARRRLNIEVIRSASQIISTLGCSSSVKKALLSATEWDTKERLTSLDEFLKLLRGQEDVSLF